MLRELLMVADQCPNVYTDTSGIAGWGRSIGLSPVQAIRRAVDVLGAQRITFGSDSTFFPRGWRREVFDEQIRTFQEAGLSERQVRQIRGENLASML